MLLLSGCDHGLTNQQISDQSKFCESHGLETRVIQNGWDYSIIRVQCMPKEAK